MTQILAYTLVSPDGVIGLNGRQYLLDDEGEVILFKSLDEAKEFIEEAGEDPDDEYIDYAEVDEEGNEIEIFIKNKGE